MKKELDEKLCSEFPAIFRDRHASMTETAMCWGFECGDGWFDLIRGLCSKLSRYSLISGVAINASQVKEKYGTLRFYVESADDIAHDLIQLAENRSAWICEECGESGKTRGGGWLKTLCDKCALELDYMGVQ